MAEIQVFHVTEDADFETIFDIRRVVFVEEQNVPEEEEYDGYDHISQHYLAVCDGKAAGTARWRVTPFGKVKCERFAVLKEFRRKGVGAALVEAVLKDVPKDREVYLNSQVDAISLYEKFGFVATGDIFDECGILHRRMHLEA